MGAVCTGKHGEERGKEAPPRDMEGARVRVAIVEDDELGRLVLGVNLHVRGATARGRQRFAAEERVSCPWRTGMVKTRPKMSLVPRELMPFFSW